MLQVAIEFDGLLARFGRVVPDSLAMLESLAAIRRRVPGRLQTMVVRLAADLNAERAGDFQESLKRSKLASYFHPLADRAAVVTELNQLETVSASTTGADGDDWLFLSARRHHVAMSHGDFVQPFLVGWSGPPGQPMLSFEDVPRIIEERLRIPTARPMSRVARTGGLLAIAVENTADARQKSQTAMASDKNADWVTIDDTFVLYTEEPDLEDQLVDDAGFRRLSFAVNKESLVIDPAQSSEQSWLLRTSHFGLRLRTEDDALRQEGPERVLDWNDVRRGSLPTVKAAREGSTHVPSEAELEGHLQKVQSAFQLALTGAVKPDVLHDAFAQALAEQLPASGCVDLCRRGEAAAAFSWMTPYGNDQAETIVVVIHDADRLSQPRSPAIADQLALAVALGRVFEGHTVPAVLTCLRFSPEVSADFLLDTLLLPSEKTRIETVMQLGHWSPTSDASGKRRIQAAGDQASSVEMLIKKLAGALT